MTRLCFRHDLGGPWSHWIARLTGAPVHCGFDIDGRFYQADSPAGVQALETDAMLATGQWTVFDVPTYFDAEALLAFCAGEVGAKYDRIGVLFAWWAPAFVHGNAHRWFCSEYCARGLNVARVALPRSRPASYTPRRLYTDICALRWLGKAVGT